MRWFGPSWGAPCCDPERHIDTPIGEACAWCDEPIGADDSGVTLGPLASPTDTDHHHLNCWLRQVVGPLAHQTGECSCAGRDDPYQDAMTPREEADAAVAWFYDKHGH